MTAANLVLLTCFLGFAATFAGLALLLLLLDLTGLTYFWRVEPYNRRQTRRHLAARRRRYNF